LSASRHAGKAKEMTTTSSTLRFDFDTLTVSQALPWFRGAIVILVGCTIAAVLGLFGLPLASPPRTPRIFAQTVFLWSPITRAHWMQFIQR
jgi:hypothetical protein